MSRHGWLPGLLTIFPRQTTRASSAVATTLIALVLTLATPGTGQAEPPRSTDSSVRTGDANLDSLPRQPTPLEDDAQLHDVQFVTSQLGWAVGDHGVIWHTRDGGEEWHLQTSGVTCAMYSVWFLTDGVGWAAGGGTMPFTRLSYGVLLHTTDGGRTWQTLLGPPDRKGGTLPTRSEDAVAEGAAVSEKKGPAKSTAPKKGIPLPRLTRVKFFSLDEGFVVGQGSVDQPSGVFFTDDGGTLWRDLPGQASPGWLAADFLNPEAGVVAGPRGRIAQLNGQQLTAPRGGNLGLRGLHDVVLQGPRSGWLVGDGGLVRRTSNAGLVWEAPPASLPEGIRDACDFQAVCCRGKNVWIAGKPGSVVWHSADGGESWQKQTTGESVPIAAIHFASDRCGFAVGALGMILRTDDGGRTWDAVRGGGRRAAILMLEGSQPQIALEPIVELSGESGYRSVVSVIASDDSASAITDLGEPALSARLADAVSLAGGSAGQVEWQLPLEIPGLERDREKLIAEWNRRTEGRLEEVLVGSLVRQLRTWRPSVLILEQPAAGDALTRLINDAAMKAIDQAKDSTRFPEQQKLAGLEPWQVAKVFLHLPPGSTGHVQVDPHQYLARLQETAHLAAVPATSLLFEQTAGTPVRQAYRLLRTQWDAKMGPSIAASFFDGLSIPPGSDARRKLLPIDESDLAARIKLANRQKIFAAHTDKALVDPQKAGQLIAQLSDVVRGMPEAQGALQLAELAERYHEHGHWELAELTLVELVEKYPAEPAALRAMQQLVQYWASAEITWRRLKRSATQQQKERSDPSGVSQAIVQVEARLDRQAQDQERTLFDVDAPREAPEPIRAPARATVTAGYTARKDLEQKIRYWQAQAVRMARTLEQRAPQLAGAPEVQFPLAAVFRQREKFARSDEIYRRFLQQESTSAWFRPAELEMWLTRPIAPPGGPATECVRASRRPMLDGVLSDPCWQEAAEMTLAKDGIAGKGRTTDSDGALAMLCYDDEYLYLAASVPRAAGVRPDGPVSERRYDDDLTDFDRMTFYLDTDRDRVTYFSFTVDQRGCTNEACWQDRTWNPQGCAVKVDADERQWRLEAAIPFSELSSRPPVRGAAWGVGVVRTIPAVGWQSWTQPAGDKPRPETFGLVRFD
ncbi:MAG TPA: YCF48-related protein [Planctomycetaceae bacterium]|nr:YCF48-related protein [Planctomycetaceae bacterium]